MLFKSNLSPFVLCLGKERKLAIKKTMALAGMRWEWFKMLSSNWEENLWPWTLGSCTAHNWNQCEYHMQQNEKMSLTHPSFVKECLPFCSESLKGTISDESNFSPLSYFWVPFCHASVGKKASDQKIWGSITCSFSL